MNLIRETLTTVLGFMIPEEITVDGVTAEADKYDDDDGDYIEYSEYTHDEEHTWDINIFMSGCEANIRASIDGDEIRTIAVDVNSEPYLDGPIEELCKEIEMRL